MNNFQFGNLQLDLSSPIQWMGGKGQLLPEIERRVPNEFNRYYEPFIGGGAVLFDLKPDKAYINDLNTELTCVYKCIQDKRLINNLIDRLENIQNEYNESPDKKGYYYSVRQKSPNYNDLVELTSRFIFLNRTCFNAVYRVNSKGLFNTPWNKSPRINLFNRRNLINISNYLSNHVTIFNSDYKECLVGCSKGDFVYLDPPYDPLNNSGKKCSDYTSNGFTSDNQKDLSELCRYLNRIGVKFLLSNHNTPLIRELYSDFTIDVVLANRKVNRDKNGRGNVEEVLIYNY